MHGGSAMHRPKRRNTIWLAALTSLVAIVLLAGSVTAPVAAALVGVIALATAMAFFDFDMLTMRRSLVSSIQERSPLNRSRARVSPQAREATERAAARAGFFRTNLELIDIGMISTQGSGDGMVMRRTRTISKDDDGVRPFITLHVPASDADRTAHIRFEATDQNGRDLYVHEMNVYVREGEVNVLADHHLPLAGNPQVEGMGDWDMRAYVDGVLVGVHNFALSPSYDERRQRLRRDGGQYYHTGGDAEIRRGEPASAESDGPLSLEELLRGQDSDR